MATQTGSIDLKGITSAYSDQQQYFWVESDSSATWGGGAHITNIAESAFKTAAGTWGTDPTAGGYNLLMNTDTISGTGSLQLRNGSLPIMNLDNDSLDFNIIDTTATPYSTINVATFGTNQVRIGQKSQSHSIITPYGHFFYGSDGITPIANIGGLSNMYFYTFGTRSTDYMIAQYSFSEGINTAAGGLAAHSEGQNTRAISLCAHAEGYDTEATGYYSHAQNNGTIAAKESQTAIGAFNVKDEESTYAEIKAFIIGNGTDDDHRSNAFTVDWSGNVEAAGALFSAGAEFSKKTGNHIVVGGIHICWGAVTIAASANVYSEVQVTLPYTYQSNPICLASLGNRAAQARTAYATQGSLAGNKIYVGCYSTAARDIYVSWMTIGV